MLIQLGRREKDIFYGGRRNIVAYNSNLPEQLLPSARQEGQSTGWVVVNQEEGASGEEVAPRIQMTPWGPLVGDGAAEVAHPNEGGDGCNQKLPSSEGGPRLQNLHL